MNKKHNLSESDFLELSCALVSAFFLVGAAALPDRNTMLSGFVNILTQTCKVSTNYFAVGGYSATFFNMGVMGLYCLALFVLLGGTMTSVSTLAVLLTVGFSAWGINPLNATPTVLGVFLYCLVKREKLSANVNAMVFSTGIAPLISDLLLRYPTSEYIGFNGAGLAVGMGVGLLIGFCLPAGLVHSPKVHKGFDLYSAALPVGMMAFFLNAMLFKTMGLTLPSAPDAESLKIASSTVCNIFCIILFGTCVIMSMILGATPKDYWKLLTDKNNVTSFSGTYGGPVFLMNMGVFGLFLLTYYNLIGANFNAVTFGVIFCMLCTCNSGSHPGNVWPIMLGYVVSAFVFGKLSALAGGGFSGAINAQAIVVGLCFANGLSPVSRNYGWFWGCVAGCMHYVLVTSVPTLHGGFCLYNGGFTAALVCLILIPLLERFTKTKAEKAAV